MAKAGWDVTVLEKHDIPGGRARVLKENGFVFDMGPSWYWMPGVFERFFNCFGKKVEDYYELQRLDPSYRIYWKSGCTDLPADYGQLKNLFESIETGSAEKLDQFMEEAEPYVRDDAIAGFDQKSEEFLARITSGGQSQSASAKPDCALLLELRAAMKALVDTQRSKWSYMFDKLDKELAR